MYLSGFVPYGSQNHSDRISDLGGNVLDGSNCRFANCYSFASAFPYIWQIPSVNHSSETRPAYCSSALYFLFMYTLQISQDI